jgi:hypothetical protein
MKRKNNNKSQKMIKYSIVILSILAIYFIVKYIENMDINHIRNESYTFEESLKNKVLVRHYKLLNQDDTLFFSVEDAWVEMTPKYDKDILVGKSTLYKNFIINVKYKKHPEYSLENYSQMWMIGVDSSKISGIKGEQLFICNSKFDDKILVKVMRLKKPYDYKNKFNELIYTLKFEKEK